MDVNTANQSTTDEQMMDILLVLDKEKKTISAVKGVDENGELQTVPPENNSELLKFDRHGDFFSNFFSNMMNQLKNPTRFNFFKIPKLELPKIEPIIRDNFNNPTPENEAGIERYRVTPEIVKQEIKKVQQETQNGQQPAKETGATAQAPQQPDKSKYVIDPDKVDWEALKNFGLSSSTTSSAASLSEATVSGRLESDKSKFHSSLLILPCNISSILARQPSHFAFVLKIIVFI